VIRTPSEVDNQSTENKASNEGDYGEGQHCEKIKSIRRKKHTLDDGEDEFG